MTAISHEYRAANCDFGDDRDKIIRALEELDRLVRKADSFRPPIDYLIHGLHDIRISQAAIDVRKHPQFASINRMTKPHEASIPSADELYRFARELSALKISVQDPHPWHYGAAQLLAYIQALQEGKLIFGYLVKDH